MNVKVPQIYFHGVRLLKPHRRYADLRIRSVTKSLQFFRGWLIWIISNLQLFLHTGSLSLHFYFQFLVFRFTTGFLPGLELDVQLSLVFLACALDVEAQKYQEVP